jgi:hypothetical protein
LLKMALLNKSSCWIVDVASMSLLLLQSLGSLCFVHDGN